MIEQYDMDKLSPDKITKLAAGSKLANLTLSCTLKIFKITCKLVLMKK